MVYINNGEHDNPHELPKQNLEGFLNKDNAVYMHFDLATKLPEEIEYPMEHTDDTLYPQINNDIKYGLFKIVIDSYYLNSQIRDDFTYTQACYVHNDTNNILETRPQCTHTCDHISQQQDSLADTEQQHKVYTSEVDASLITGDTSTQCAFNVIPTNTDMETDKPIEKTPQNNTSIHFHSKHKYRDTFRDAHTQYHNFDNGDAFTYKDKYTALLQQELQNLYWCLHDPVITISYQISTEMDIETMPHAVYFSGNTETVTKINHVPCQTVQYDDKGAFPAKVMDELLHRFLLIMEQHLPFP